MTTSPNYASDFITKLNELVPGAFIVADGASRNTWAGRERPIDETQADFAVFVQEFSGRREENNDATQRWPMVNVLIRTRTESVAGGYSQGQSIAKTLHDTMDRLGMRPGSVGNFTINGNVYQAIVAAGTGPDHVDFDNECEYFAESFEMWIHL